MSQETLNTIQILKKLNKIHLLVSPFAFINKVLNKLLQINSTICFKVLKFFLKEKHQPNHTNNIPAPKRYPAPPRKK